MVFSFSLDCSIQFSILYPVSQLQLCTLSKQLCKLCWSTLCIISILGGGFIWVNYRTIYASFRRFWPVASHQFASANQTCFINTVNRLKRDRAAAGTPTSSCRVQIPSVLMSTHLLFLLWSAQSVLQCVWSRVSFSSLLSSASAGLNDRCCCALPTMLWILWAQHIFRYFYWTELFPLWFVMTSSEGLHGSD